MRETVFTLLTRQGRAVARRAGPGCVWHIYYPWGMDRLWGRRAEIRAVMHCEIREKGQDL